MALSARELMQRHLVCVSPDDPLSSVQRLFFEEEIHGAPVIDDEERLVGVISSIDLLRAAADGLDSPGLDAFTSDPPGFPAAEGGLGDRLAGQRVSDVMSTDVVSVEADAPVSEVARALRENRVHRVMVLDRKRVCGVISTFDLVALLEEDQPAERGGPGPARAGTT